MAFHIYFAYILFLLSTGSLIPASTSPFGINYGQIADNLPSPEKVIPILKSIGVSKVKLYDPDSRVLRAFANTGVEFIVGLPNQCLSKMQDTSKAITWIKENIQPYLPATKITCITVGNEVFTSNDTTLMNNLLPAMQNVHSALTMLGLDKQVSITTAHSMAILETSYPPSKGAFRRDLTKYISSILCFHSKTGSSFLINAYPYFAYKSNPKQISLDFVLFESDQGILDPATNLHYENMLFAQIDAVYTALAGVGYGNILVQISETGWPSKGDEDEVGATAENARKYNGNLMKLISEKKGTPKKPSCNLDLYVFALFNENLKPGPTSERNYGLFKPDGTPAYQLGLVTINGNSSINSNGGGVGNGNGNGVALVPSPEDSSTTDFLSISSATEELRFALLVLYMQGLILLW